MNDIIYQNEEKIKRFIEDILTDLRKLAMNYPSTISTIGRTDIQFANRTFWIEHTYQQNKILIHIYYPCNENDVTIMKNQQKYQFSDGSIMLLAYGVEGDFNNQRDKFIKDVEKIIQTNIINLTVTTIND